MCNKFVDDELREHGLYEEGIQHHDEYSTRE